ncbi:unnamed protein product [Lymnaea stagnalis]|uniref:Uncharacterized protein n=1 Tax=Lymnaea stagnalis TaxID=6523 RepID=A0AAV2HEK9_LYMST
MLLQTMEYFKIAAAFIVIVHVGCVMSNSCSLGADCSNIECCVQDPSTKQGVCRRMGDVADYCYTKQPYAWTKPEKMVTQFDLCPCETGYFCGPIGKESATYGPMGICSFG